RVQRHMPEPGADGVDVDPGTKQMDRGRMPDRVRAHPLRGHRWHGSAGSLLRFRKTASLLPRLAISLDSDVAVTGHNGQARNLFPLPCSRTDDCAPSCRRSMVSVAASSARAPLLYKNRSKAWSRSPRGARRSGWARRASISTFSRYPISVLAVFLNGVARISAHQATCAGER